MTRAPQPDAEAAPPPDAKADSQPDPQSAQDGDAAARRRRLARVFGEVLPEQTADDRPEESSDPERLDAWLRAQVPPHHG